MVLLGAWVPREASGYQEASPGGFPVIALYSVPWFGRTVRVGSRAGFSYVIWAGGWTLLSGLCPQTSWGGGPRSRRRGRKKALNAKQS